MVNPDILAVASIGGFGHSVLVFEEMLPHVETMRLVAMAPAYPGEVLDSFSGHPLAQRDRPEIFSNAESLFESTKPAVAVVSTQPGQIASQVITALRAGSHVIAEKPLASAEGDLVRLHQEWRQAQKGLMAMLNMRSFPAFGAAHRAYQQGLIGEVVAANARKSYKWGRRPEWFSERSKYGGTFPWVGIHALDIIHFVTGQGFTEVSAMQGNLGHPDRSGCEDVCVGIFRLENGALATVSVDYFRPGGAATHGDDWCRIVGTRGIIEANASQGWCRLLDAEGATPRDLPLDPPLLLFAPFLDAARQGTSLAKEALIGFHLTDACLSARAAAETGERRRIDPRRWS